MLPSVVDDAGTHIAAAHDWLESFQLGYSRGDPSTYRTENLPTSFKGARVPQLRCSPVSTFRCG